MWREGLGLVKRTARALFAIVVLSFCACEKKSESYITYVNEVEKQFILEVRKDLHLQCYAEGGSMRNDVIYISLSFMSFSNTNVEDARLIEVELIERFLRIVNNHKKIRPYLREYPFPCTCVDIGILFQPVKYENNSLRSVSSSLGHLCYYKHDNWHKDYVPDLKEPYEDAYNIVQAARPEIAHIFREQK
jgi:hypothetical protein